MRDDQNDQNAGTSNAGNPKASNSTADNSMVRANEELEQEFNELETRLASPSDFTGKDGTAAYAKAAKRYNELRQIVIRLREQRQLSEDIAVAQEMLTEVAGDESKLLQTEIDEAQSRVNALNDELLDLLILKDPNDSKNVIIEIRGAEGGEEANLFARDLFDMYQSYAARRGWKVELLGAQLSPMSGYTDVAFMLSGEGVWATMKYEGGPHRVQRVPVTESQGRVHTSSATVSVLPEADEVEIEIDENDIETNVYRSSGPGGQSVNTTDSAVRIIHKPTGLVVTMQDEKSQLQNKSKALRVLRARLAEMEQRRQAEELSSRRKDQIGGGGRGEKIRTYNFKENRVTDHRIGLTIYKLERILSGELEEISEALATWERKKALQEAGQSD